MEKYYLVCFDRNSGKIDICLEAQGKALLKMWALQNTTRTKDTIVFEKSSGVVDTYYTGTNDFPEIEENAGNIEDYCPGFLKAINEGEQHPDKEEHEPVPAKSPLAEQLKEAKKEKNPSTKKSVKRDDPNLNL